MRMKSDQACTMPHLLPPFLPTWLNDLVEYLAVTAIAAKPRQAAARNNVRFVIILMFK
jgi:hypothetical protein